MKIKINKNKENISKLLENNYIILLLISYSYLIYKIINNSFKEIIVYLVSVILFYSYFKDLKKSYIFGFFVLLIRLTYKQLFKTIENFGTTQEDIDKKKEEIDKDEKETEENVTSDPVAEAETDMSEKDIEELEEDEDKKDKFIKTTNKGIKDDVKNHNIDGAI